MFLFFCHSVVTQTNICSCIIILYLNIIDWNISLSFIQSTSSRSLSLISSLLSIPPSLTTQTWWSRSILSEFCHLVINPHCSLTKIMTAVFAFVSRYYNWSTAAPIVLAMQAFQKPLPKVNTHTFTKYDTDWRTHPAQTHTSLIKWSCNFGNFVLLMLFQIPFISSFCETKMQMFGRMSDLHQMWMTYIATLQKGHKTNTIKVYAPYFTSFFLLFSITHL